ncbi:hypothetical protein JOB18_004562 [Solea senegalensis]|uniref:Anterior gradient 1 n=1 Tax=Solea senegalensis TaxID=28829 RepID=A0AAV6R9F3_SOLSE|nr:hypothetical protein JOB18_004562 [Solea senegalensis]
MTKKRRGQVGRLSADTLVAPRCQVLRKGQEVMLRWILLALLFGVCASGSDQKKKKEKSPPRGWGNSISWVANYEEGLAKAVSSKKPLMVIHHLEDCPHSQALKKAFVADKSIQKMAREDFIMLNVVKETGDPNMAPDGFYVPRILFVDPSLSVRNDVTGRFSNNLYTYEKGDMELLAENMKKAKLLLHDEL